MTNMAIFASGNGSNFVAITKAVQNGEINAKVSILICDNPDANVIQKAKDMGIRVFAFDPKKYESKEAYEKKIVGLLKSLAVDFIALAGYMRLVGSTMLNSYEGKIVNIHPSLLPKFPGKNAIERAFEANEQVTGVTVHYVDSGMDTGEIIAQAIVDISEEDAIETLKEKIHKTEHQLYVKTLKEITA